MEVKIPSQKVCVSLKPEKFNISLGTQIAREYVEREPYEGEYTITPSAEAVVLETTGLRMTDNVTVNPIPNNYGLITWNGNVITVS